MNFWKMKNNKTRKILISTTIIFLIILVASIWWFYFVTNQADDVLDLKKSAQREEAQNYNLTDLKRNINDFEVKEAELNQIFVDKDNIVIFIEKIERMAEQSGATFDIQIKDDEVKEGNEESSSLNMFIQSTGSWSNITTFLRMIENLPHHVVIGTTNLNTKNTEAGVLWGINLSLTIAAI